MYYQRSILTLCCLFVCTLIQAQPQRAHKTAPTAQLNQKNMCCVGAWHERPVWTLAYDQSRNILILGSCGCVCLIDISDPTHFKKLKEFTHSQCNTSGLFYQPEKNRLYICDGLAGLKIWDLTDVQKPIEIGSYDTPGYACAVHVLDDYAYIADAERGLRIIDVSSPEHPREIGVVDMTTACDIFVQGQYAYVADIGLRIIDISNPHDPQDIGYHETPGIACGLYVRHNLVYVADEWCGLRIIDMSDPMNPYEVSHVQTPGHVWSVYVTGSLAYSAAYDAGLRVVDVRNPRKPLEVAFHETTDDALHATVMGSRIYIAAAGQGMLVYHLE